MKLMAMSKNIFKPTYSVFVFAVFLLFGCGGGGGGGFSNGTSIVQVPLTISSGGITVGSNSFSFKQTDFAKNQNYWPHLFQNLLIQSADAATVSYRVSPDKVKLWLTGFNFIPVEQNVDTSTEDAFNSALSCEIDYDKTIPNQTYTCTVELQAGLHYKTIDFHVASNVDIYINDSTNNIYSTLSGITNTNPGAGLDYYTATFGSNTSFHAEFPYQVDTSMLSTTLSKDTIMDACGNTIEVKSVLSDGTVLSDTTYTPATACNVSGTTTNTVNIGTQGLNVVVDMIHGIQVDDNAGTLSVNTTVPWWTIVGTIGTGVSVKHYASTASGLTSGTYQFPPSVAGINELKVAYANGVAVAVQMVPNGTSSTFCTDDYDTPNNSPGNGYVGSDTNGTAWAVGPWSSGSMTSYTSEYYLNSTTYLFSCEPISADPDPNPGQTLDTFSTKMPDPSSWTYSQAMTRIDN